MVSPLPPEEVLATLGTHGQDWRESKLPVGVRWGITQCRIKIDGNNFTLRFWPTPAGEIPLEWIGQVTASGEGSMLSARSAVTRFGRWMLPTRAIVIVLVAWFPLHAGPWSLFILLMFGAADAAFTGWLTARDRKLCELVLTHVVSARASETAA